MKIDEACVIEGNRKTFMSPEESTTYAWYRIAGGSKTDQRIDTVRGKERLTITIIGKKEGN